MARIAATEEADDIRDEEDVSSAEEQAAPSSEGDAHTTQDKQIALFGIPSAKGSFHDHFIRSITHHYATVGTCDPRGAKLIFLERQGTARRSESISYLLHDACNASNTRRLADGLKRRQ
jgi:hypothetical protein